MTHFTTCIKDSALMHIEHGPDAHRTCFLNGLWNLLCRNCRNISVLFSTGPRGPHIAGAVVWPSGTRDENHYAMQYSLK